MCFTKTNINNRNRKYKSLNENKVTNLNKILEVNSEPPLKFDCNNQNIFSLDIK